MKKVIIKIILFGSTMGTLLYSGCVGDASNINNNVFTIKESNVLSVTEGNKNFIEKDEIDYFDSLNIAEELRKDVNGKTSSINVIHKNDENLQFRKEVTLHDEGHLELTVKMKVFPFTDNTALSPFSSVIV